MGIKLYLTDDGLGAPGEERPVPEGESLQLIVTKDPKELEEADAQLVRAALALGFEIVYEGAPRDLMCPCCGSYPFSERNSYEICPVCGWEDDPLQRRDESVSGGANAMSLREAREEFRRKIHEQN